MADNSFKRFGKKDQNDNMPAPSILGGDRTLPHNTEAEIAVLGCVLLAPSEVLDSASAKLGAGAFYNEKHKIIFQAICEVMEDSKTALDIITLSEYLSRRSELTKVGGEDYLFQLMNSVPTAANAEKYIEIVYENSILRRLIATGSDIVNKSFDKSTPVKELLDSVEQEILEIGNTNTGKDYQPISALIKGAVNHLDQLYKGIGEAAGISSGYPDLDRMITGFRPGNMVVLAARPAIGKTAFTLNLCTNIALEAENPVGVGVFSLEMGASELVVRLICSVSGVSSGAIKDQRLHQGEWNRVIQAAHRLKDAPIYIDDTPSIDVLELRAKCRRMHREHGIGIVMIDYLQLMTAPAGSAASREQEVAKMSMAIKALAKELRIPVIVLAQLNRQAEQPGQRPKATHLRESGSIEQDADIVALLHRDRDEQQEGGDPTVGLKSELIVAKNRAGGTGICPLMFFPHLTRFESYSGIEETDMP